MNSCVRLVLREIPANGISRLALQVYVPPRLVYTGENIRILLVGEWIINEPPIILSISVPLGLSKTITGVSLNWYVKYTKQPRAELTLTKLMLKPGAVEKEQWYNQACRV